MKGKLKGLEELQRLVREEQSRGRRVVFTNGCFDLLHIGHIRYLREAKASGELLIVGVNSDRSVRMLKGKGRPLTPLEERVELLKALEMVDYLITFEQETAAHLLQAIKPDLYVKGGDYTPETLPEWEVVKGYGGEVKLVSEYRGRSTSAIIERIKKGAGE